MSLEAILRLAEAVQPAAALFRPSGEAVAAGDSFVALCGPPADGAAWCLADLGLGGADFRQGVEREGVIVRADGTTFMAEMRAREFEGAEGGRLVLVTLRDVTAARRRLRELEEMSEFPLLNPSPVLRFDPAARILLANPAAEALFGIGPLQGRDWREVCPGLDEALWARMKQPAPPPLEVAVGGETVRFSHVRLPHGDIITAFGVLTTDFRKAEALLAEKAQELAELARFPDMNPGPVLRASFDGTILLANAAARALFGERLEGSSWLTTGPGVGAAGAWEKILAAGEVVSLEGRVGERDFVFAHRSDPVTSLVFIYGNDVTGQRRAERVLRQSEKMATLGTLAAGVAHELNNPAAAVRRAAEQLREKLAALEAAHLGFDLAALAPAAHETLSGLLARGRSAGAQAGELDPLTRSDREAELEDWFAARGVDEGWSIAAELVRAGVGPPDLDGLADAVDAGTLGAALGWLSAALQVDSLAYTVGQGAGRLSEIVGALKGYAYLGQAPVQAVDLREGINNTLVILRNKLKEGIAVHLDYAEDLPPVPAYGSELNQVWTNLIDNAADAMKGKGNLTIRTRRADGWAVIELEDDGPGIPAEIQSRVFDPFFTTKAPGKGTGLGLSTTYSIVTEKHKGRIELDSHPGRTRFTVRLPLAEAGGPA